MQPWAALLIGLAAGLVCYYACHLKIRFKYDDSLDVVGVHMVGGVIGILLTGVFATLVVNASGAAGGLTQLGRQALLDLVALGFPFVGTLLLLMLTDRLVGVRVSAEDEIAGLDLPRVLLSAAVRDLRAWLDRIRASAGGELLEAGTVAGFRDYVGRHLQ